MGSDDVLTMSIVGTKLYCAPEVITGQRYNESARADKSPDFRKLVDVVKDSDALVLFQSKEVLRSPSCLIELDAAITHGIPIVALSCVGKKYDFVAAVDFLLHLETS